MQFFSHLANHSSSKRPQDSFMHRILNDPYLDWAYMIVIATILTIISAGVGFGMYFDMKSHLSSSVSIATTTKVSTFDSSTLSRVLNNFNGRALERERILNTGSVIGDPSL